MNQTLKDNEKLWESIRKFGPEGDLSDDAAKIFNQLKDHIKDEQFARRIAGFYLRDHFVANFSWAIPSKPAINLIKQFVDEDIVLEINAGLGLWSKLLQDEGTNIIATDPYEYKDKTSYTTVVRADHFESINKFGNEANVLMTCWPDYNKNYAAEALDIFKGNKLIYIGESWGGCTADDSFHASLNKIWQLKETEAIPQWTGLRDRLHLYTRA